MLAMPSLCQQAPPASKKGAASKAAAAQKAAVASTVGSKRQRSAAGFSDHNASWLKPSKKQQQDSDSEDEEADEFESGSLDEDMSADLGSSDEQQSQSEGGSEEGSEEEEEPPSKKTKPPQKDAGTRSFRTSVCVWGGGGSRTTSWVCSREGAARKCREAGAAEVGRGRGGIGWTEEGRVAAGGGDWE